MQQGGVGVPGISMIKKVKTKPYYLILFMFFIIFFLIYSARIFNFESEIAHLTTGCILAFLIMIMVTITILVNLGVKNSALQYADNVTNTPACKNVIVLFSFLFFVIYLYEIAEFDNNKPHTLIDTILFGHNNIISNRSVGIVYIIIFGLFTGYTLSLNIEDCQINIQ